MFTNACTALMNTLYAVLVGSRPASDHECWTLGTGFQVAPGVLATAAHLFEPHAADQTILLCHFRQFPADAASPPAIPFDAIPLARDPTRDLALLRFPPVTSASSVTLRCTPVAMGSSCGLLGFPYMRLEPQGRLRVLQHQLQFRGGHVAAYAPDAVLPAPEGAPVPFAAYYVDFPIPPGMSGGPLFLPDGRVFGLASTTGQVTPPAPAAAVNMLSGAEILAAALEHGVFQVDVSG